MLNSLILPQQPNEAVVVEHNAMAVILFSNNTLDNAGVESSYNKVIQSSNIKMKQLNE